MRFLFSIFFFTLFAGAAQAFCGFFVAKADGSLYNQSSKVVYVRDGRSSFITMSADYRGPTKDFAMIIPTPKVLTRQNIGLVSQKTVDHLDNYTAPRLVEYHDEDPCAPRVFAEPLMEAAPATRRGAAQKTRGAAALGVKIKGEYAVGNYDIVILSAKQSDGLVVYLTQEGYKLPEGAKAVLGDYISKGMKFFVARVNLDRHQKSKSKELPPLQIAFRSRDFMLPIQLGKLNAEETQDALFFMLTRKGRVEVANYNAKPVPSNVNIPTFVKDMFPEFYRTMFKRAAPARGGIVMEYAWDMAWCDPCAADPLSTKQLRELGVRWLDETAPNSGQDVYVTRFHAQYKKSQMMKDIAFKVTNNRKNFQGRYVMNHPFKGKITCEAGKEYVQRKRLELREEAVNLARLTGWSPRKIEQRIRKSVPKTYW